MPFIGAPITRLLLNPVLTYMFGAVLDTANIASPTPPEADGNQTVDARAPRIAAPVSDP